MGDIERWKADRERNGGDWQIERDRFGTMFSGTLEVGEMIEVVPLDAYRGAVAALREIAAGKQTRDGTVYRLTREEMMALAHRASSTTAGGQ